MLEACCLFRCGSVVVARCRPGWGPVVGATVVRADDRPHALVGLQRSLLWSGPGGGGARGGWRVGCVHSRGSPCRRGRDGYVVTDMRMPRMSSAQLPGVVRDRHPALARRILCGYADGDAVIAAARLTQRSPAPTGRGQRTGRRPAQTPGELPADDLRDRWRRRRPSRPDRRHPRRRGHQCRCSAPGQLRLLWQSTRPGGLPAPGRHPAGTAHHLGAGRRRVSSPIGEALARVGRQAAPGRLGVGTPAPMATPGSGCVARRQATRLDTGARKVLGSAGGNRRVIHGWPCSTFAR